MTKTTNQPTAEELLWICSACGHKSGGPLPDPRYCREPSCPDARTHPKAGRIGGLLVALPRSSDTPLMAELRKRAPDHRYVSDREIVDQWLSWFESGMQIPGSELRWFARIFRELRNELECTRSRFSIPGDELPEGVGTSRITDQAGQPVGADPARQSGAPGVDPFGACQVWIDGFGYLHRDHSARQTCQMAIQWVNLTRRAMHARNLGTLSVLTQESGATPPAYEKGGLVDRLRDYITNTNDVDLRMEAAQLIEGLSRTMACVYARLQGGDVPQGDWQREVSDWLMMGTPPDAGQSEGVRVRGAPGVPIGHVFAAYDLASSKVVRPFGWVREVPWHSHDFLHGEERPSGDGWIPLFRLPKMERAGE